MKQQHTCMTLAWSALSLDLSHDDLLDRLIEALEGVKQQHRSEQFDETAGASSSSMAHEIVVLALTRRLDWDRVALDVVWNFASLPELAAPTSLRIAIRLCERFRSAELGLSSMQQAITRRDRSSYQCKPSILP